MLHADIIRSRLNAIIGSTTGADQLPPPGGFGLEKAANERRILDNYRSGRHAYRKARLRAREGLEALDGGEIEAAQDHLCDAMWHMLTALASMVKPSQMAEMLDPAGSRGRRHSDRNRRLVEAVALQENAGLKGRAAINAALDADPGLKAECRDMKPDAMSQAVRRGR